MYRRGQSQVLTFGTTKFPDAAESFLQKSFRRSIDAEQDAAILVRDVLLRQQPDKGQEQAFIRRSALIAFN